MKNCFKTSGNNCKLNSHEKNHAILKEFLTGAKDEIKSVDVDQVTFFLVDREADEYVNRIYTYTYLRFTYSSAPLSTGIKSTATYYTYLRFTYSSASLSTRIKSIFFVDCWSVWIILQQFWLHFEWSKMSPTTTCLLFFFLNAVLKIHIAFYHRMI